MPERWSRSLRTIAAIAASVVLLGSWLLASPHGSDPDGGFHLISIVCAEGFDETRCLEEPTKEDRVLAPFAIVNSSCANQNQLRIGACSEEGFLAPEGQYIQASFANLSGARPNLYYRTMHRLLGEDLNASVFMIRAVNALAAILLLLASAAIAPAGIRQALLLSWLLIAVPLILFLITSANTSAWGIIGISTFWANLATLIQARPRSIRIAAFLLLTTGAVMALGARTEALASLAIVTVGVLLWSVPQLRTGLARLAPRRRTISIASTIALVGAAVATAFLTLPVGRTAASAISEFGVGLETLDQRGFGNPVVWMLAEAWQFTTGVFGDRWTIGWLDTPMPTVVMVGTLGTLAGVAFIGIAQVGRPRTAALAFLLLATLAYPWLTLIRFGLFVGEEMQPRHFVVVLHALIAMLILRDTAHERLTLSRSQSAMAWTALSVAHAFALHVAIRRYTEGLTFDWHFDLGTNQQWWWSWAPFGPMAVWWAGAVGFAIVARVVLGLTAADRDQAA